MRRTVADSILALFVVLREVKVPSHRTSRIPISVHSWLISRLSKSVLVQSHMLHVPASAAKARNSITKVLVALNAKSCRGCGSFGRCRPNSTECGEFGKAVGNSASPLYLNSETAFCSRIIPAWRPAKTSMTRLCPCPGRHGAFCTHRLIVRARRPHRLRATEELTHLPPT